MGGYIDDEGMMGGGKKGMVIMEVGKFCGVNRKRRKVRVSTRGGNKVK